MNRHLPLFFALSMFLASIAQATPPTVHLDSATGNYVIEYDGENGRVQAVFEPSTKISPALSVSVLETTQGGGNYTYRLSNSSQGRQNIWTFNLTPKPAPATITSPTGWRYSEYAHDPLAGWVMESLIRNPTFIRPGHSADFGITSANLPDICEARIEGLPAPGNLAFPEEPGEDVEELLSPLHQIDFVAIKTLCPVFDSQNIAPDALVGRLVGLKHQSASEGWLGDAKFIQKLDRRLDEAKAALGGDKKKLARVRLTQFVHDLTEVHEEHGEAGHEHGKDKDEHRREKFVNDEAFQLLKINADFIIAKLPTKAKDRDEDDECRRAESEKDDSHDARDKKDDDRRGGKEHGR